MIAHDATDRRIARWLASVATEANPANLSFVMDQLERTRQRRRGRLFRVQRAVGSMRSLVPARWVAVGVTALLLLALLGLALTIGSTLRRQPVQLARTGLLAYSQDGRIWTSAADGSGPHPLITDDNHNALPTWSRDGSRLAYWGYAPRNGGQRPGVVSVADANGAHAHPVSTQVGTVFVNAITWSPDGARIAFTGDGGLYLAQANGSGARLLAAISSSGPAWSPVGPAWSPDGSLIAIEIDGRLMAIRVDDGTTTQISDFAANEGTAPSWSPDGILAYTGGRLRVDEPGETGIFIASLAVDGWSTSVLIRNSIWLDPYTKYVLGVYNRVPEWSNDGTQIAYLRDSRLQPGAPATTDLMVAEADGSGAHVVRAGVGLPFAWLPDDSRIAISRTNADSQIVGLLLVDPHGVADPIRIDGRWNGDWQPLPQ